MKTRSVKGYITARLTIRKVIKIIHMVASKLGGHIFLVYVSSSKTNLAAIELTSEIKSYCLYSL